MRYEGGYKGFGQSGLKISRLALGLGFRTQTDTKKAESLIREAIDKGINLIDCGNIYTLGGELNGIRSEEILGKAIKNNRDKVVITSKVGSIMLKDRGPNEYGASRSHIMREIDKSLKRIGTDYIDVYLLHDPDPTTPFEEQFRTFETLIQQGKIRYVGLCNHKAWQVAVSLSVIERINAQKLLTVQNPYSLLNRSLEYEMFPLARYSGIGIMAYSLLGVGLLSGTYSPDEELKEDAFWGKNQLFREYFNDVFSGRVLEIVSTVKSIAEKHSVKMAQVAVAWVLSKPEITVAVMGSDTSEQLNDTIAAAQLHLSMDDIRLLDDVSEGLRMSFMNYDLKRYRRNKYERN